MPIEPTDAEVIRGAIRAQLAEVFTATVGRVVSYDPLTQTAEVQPVMKRAYNIGLGVSDFEELPPIKNVPVRQPRTGGFFMHMPVAADDHVLLIFTHDDIANWRETGTMSEPDDLRRHSLASCVALVGMHEFLDPLNTLDPVEIAARVAGMVLGQDGAATQLVWDGATIIAGLANPVLNRTSFVALADATESRLQALEAQLAALSTQVIALTAAVAGTIATSNATAAALGTHTHTFTGAVSGPTATGTTDPIVDDPPTPAAAAPAAPDAFVPIPNPVAADVLKATGPILPP